MVEAGNWGPGFPHISSPLQLLAADGHGLSRIGPDDRPTTCHLVFQRKFLYLTEIGTTKGKCLNRCVRNVAIQFQLVAKGKHVWTKWPTKLFLQWTILGCDVRLSTLALLFLVLTCRYTLPVCLCLNSRLLTPGTQWRTVLSGRQVSVHSNLRALLSSTSSRQGKTHPYGICIAIAIFKVSFRVKHFV
jgi:hypothetical protein